MPNRAPDAVNDTVSVYTTTTVRVPVLANDKDPDGDPLTVSIATAPAKGTAVVNTDKTITYDPNPGFVGTDSFTYRVRDPSGATDTAKVTVTVQANALPVARAESVTTQRNVPLVLASSTLLANDTDADGGTLRIAGVGSPINGTVTLAADRLSVTFAPTADFVGTGSFRYTVNDGRGGTAQAPVTVTVTYGEAFSDGTFFTDAYGWTS